MFLAQSPTPPSRYAAAVDLILTLPELTAGYRTHLGLTVTAQAAQIGIARDTLTRLEAGSSPNQTTIVAVLRWLGAS